MSDPTMLTDWSQEYVDEFHKQTPGRHLIGRFASHAERDRFVDAVRARTFDGVEVEPTGDGLGVGVTATRETLMEVVRAAKQFGGQILFPGALPVTATTV